MNSAFRNTARMALAQQSRFKSTAAPTAVNLSEHAFMKARMNPPSFAKTWLSDPTTYPIMLVVGFACTMCAGTGTYYLYACKDVTLSPAKRNGIMRTWGENSNRFGH